VRAIAVNRSRTGLAVAALSVACAAALGMTLMVSSFRTALTTWLATTLTADVYVSAPRLIAARVGDQALDPQLVTRILAVPGIRSVISKRDTVVPVGLPDGRLLDVTVAAFAPLPDSRLHFPARPAFANEVARNAAWDAFADGAAFVTEPFAAKQRVRTGDRLQLRTPNGNRDVVIAAVLVEYSSDQGYVYVDLAQYRTWFNDPAVTALALNAEPGVSGDELAARVRQAAGDVPLAVTPGSTLKSASLTVFDRTFAITAVIRWLAAGVAVLGLIGALAAVQLERARTTARLRALGLTPRGVIRLATTECLLTGTAAGLLAVPIGIGVAAGLTHVINRRSFGWSMDLTVDPVQLALTVVLAAGAAGVAGLLPAYRASRVRIAEALHEE
jgi:putative ABC transport system permease protein